MKQTWSPVPPFLTHSSVISYTAELVVMAKQENIEIPVLMGMSNYVRWKRDFTIVAKIRNLWAVFEGSERMVGEPNFHHSSPMGYGSMPFTDDVVLNEISLRRYERHYDRVLQAKIMLAGSMDVSLRGLILTGDETPKEALDKIARYCTMSHDQAKQFFQRHLYHMTYETRHGTPLHSGVQSYVNELLQFRQDMKDVGVAFKTDLTFLKFSLQALPTQCADIASKYESRLSDRGPVALETLFTEIIVQKGGYIY